MSDDFDKTTLRSENPTAVGAASKKKLAPTIPTDIHQQDETSAGLDAPAGGGQKAKKNAPTVPTDASDMERTTLGPSTPTGIEQLLDIAAPPKQAPTEPEDFAQTVARTDEVAVKHPTRQSAPTDMVDASDGSGLKDRISASLDVEMHRNTGDPFLGQVFLGKYAINKKLGEGGMGAVYRARQEEIDRDVAIKVLLASAAENDQSLKRFHVEALAVSKLDHPHTIRIFDFGRTDDDVLFIVMELLKGKDLNGVMRDQRVLPVSLALKVARETAESLREAHDKGIFHRDLKPDNVFLVTVDDDPNYVKVLDFGVAKIKESSQVDGTLTQAGMIFGTPRYMSPEQANADPIDGRTDLYSLGCMIYEMLTGRPPFEAGTPIGILFKHVHEAPTSFEEIRPDLVIPAEVESLVLRLLEKDPANRFPNMRGFIEAIQWLQDNLPADFDQVIRKEGVENLDTLSRIGDAGTAPDTFLEEALMRTEAARPSPLEIEEAPRSMTWLILSFLGVSLAAIAGVIGYQALAEGPPPAPLPAGFMPLFPAESSVARMGDLPVNKAVVLSIRSAPGAATAWVGGRKLGVTPVDLRILEAAEQEIPISVQLKGYQAFDTKVKADQDHTIMAKLELEKKKPVVGRPGPKAPVNFAPTKVKDTKTNPYAPGKVKDTKKNPFATKKGTKKRPFP